MRVCESELRGTKVCQRACVYFFAAAILAPIRFLAAMTAAATASGSCGVMRARLPVSVFPSAGAAALGARAAAGAAPGAAAAAAATSGAASFEAGSGSNCCSYCSSSTSTAAAATVAGAGEGDCVSSGEPAARV